LIASTHLLIGAAAGIPIAKFSRKNLVGLAIFSLFIGIISHFALDLIPHAEYTNGGFIVIFTIEVLVALAVIFIGSFDMLREKKYQIGVGAAVFGAALPDFPDLLHRILHVKWIWIEKWMEFNSIFHASPGGEIKASITMQLWLASIAFMFLAIVNFGYRARKSRN
jgi:hypothetical protein